MLLLTTTSDALSVVTSAAASIDVHASWVDNASGIITPDRKNTPTISTGTTTTVVPSPTSGVQRNVKLLSIRNRHASVACDVTLKHTDGTSNLELIKATLGAGEELLYLEGQGFQKLLANSGSTTAVFNDNSVTITGGTISGTTISDSDITPRLGNATKAGLHIPSGSALVTSALAGDVEFDGNLFYLTTEDGGRGLVPSEGFIRQNGAFTLVSQTAAQKMFNAVTNGAFTISGLVLNREYMFECVFDLSAMSAVSGAFGFAIGGTATFGSVKWDSIANKAVLATQAAPQCTMNTTVANTAIVAATTATVGWARVRGILRVNGAGTIIPQVSLGQAAAAVVGINSYFRIWPFGTTNQVSLGNWS